MLALVAAVALGQGWNPLPNPAGPIFTNPATLGSFAFFEFAPPGGQGMGSACACAAVTGAKGEPMTLTRGSSAMCSRQGTGTLTGIANGDLVLCGTNLPRVETIGGVQTLRFEEARTNGCTRSQEIDNAAWIPQNSGVAIPAITPNAATAPDGTLTAERVVIADCPAATNFSLVQSPGSVQTSASVSIYVRGNGTSGNLGLSLSSTGGPNGFTSCAYVSSSWTRCVVSATGAAATTSLYFGCGNGVVNMTPTGAADVFVWGAQVENGPFPTAYAPAVASAVTRNADAPSFAISFNTGAGFSLAASWLDAAPVASAGSVWAVAPSLFQDASNRTQLYRTFTNVVSADLITGGGTRSVAGAPTVGPYVDGVTYRLAMSATAAGAGTTISRFFDGVLVSTSAAGAASAFTATSLFPASLTSATVTQSGNLSRGCLDPDPTRCR